MELVLTGLYLQMLESKQSRMQQFFTIQEQKKKKLQLFCSIWTHDRTLSNSVEH